jgi:hypothetical protein
VFRVQRVDVGAGRVVTGCAWGRRIARLGRVVPLWVVVVVVVVGAASAVSVAAGRSGGGMAGVVAGRWAGMSEPIVVKDVGPPGPSIWTGKQMLVFYPGLTYPVPTANAIVAYTPGFDRWRRLARPPGPPGSGQGDNKAVWTGSEMIVWGIATGVFNPATNRWRPLPRSPLRGRFGAGIVVWTGREMIGWGGGCCGDAFADGAAYNPATDTWRKLPRSPLVGSQGPIGAWTGSDVLVFLDRTDVNGKPVPARARAAAYNPATNTWRRIAPLPVRRGGANVAWDGRELLVVGGAGAPKPSGAPGPLPRVGFAYDPQTNRWRRLAPMPSGRVGAAAVWTGRRLLVWGGQTAAEPRDVEGAALPPHGLAYTPATNRWSALPPAPILGRIAPIAAWAGRRMLVWAGTDPYGHLLDTGARFRPRRP